MNEDRQDELNDWLRIARKSMLRQSRFRAWTAVATTGVLVGLLMRSWVLDERMTPAVAAGGTLGIMLVLAVILRWRYRNISDVQCARHLEKTYGNLDQRLLTAVSLPTDDDRPVAEPLRRQLLSEISDHASRHDYAAVVPRWQQRLAGVSSILGTLMLSVVLASLWWQRPTVPVSASVTPTRTPDITIEPGNVEIRAGENLMVTATLRSDIARWSAADWTLLIEPDAADRSSRRAISMRRTLDDPTWAGLVREVDQDFRYRVQTQGWTSGPFEVDVYRLPQVQRIDATLTFPDYVDQPPRTIQDVTRLTAVAGTEIQWRIKLNQPVERATLVMRSGQEIRFNAATDGPVADVVSATSVVSKSDVAEIRLVDSAGRSNETPASVKITMLPNGKPTLEMLTSGDATVSPLQELPVRIKVTDDFGIRAAGMDFTFEDATTKTIDLSSEFNESADSRAANLKKVTLVHQFDFESLGAKPDQLLSYHVWVEDVDASGQTRRTMSDLYFVDVRPFDQIYRQGQPPPPGQGQSPQAKAAEELLELQKQIISATWNAISDQKRLGDPGGDDITADILVIEQSQREAIETLAQLAESVREEGAREHVTAADAAMRDAADRLSAAADGDGALPEALPRERAALSALLRLRAREFQVSQSKQSGQGAAKARRGKLNELELDEEDNRYETQSQASDSPQEQQAREDRQTLSRLRELARRQTDLNDELAALSAQMQTESDPDQIKQMQRQLKRLREQQRQMMREMDELNERSQDASAKESIQQTREVMRQSGEALQRGDTGAALAGGRRAQDDLEQMKDELRKKTAGQFDQAIRQLREKTRQLTENQDQIDDALEQLTGQSSPEDAATNQSDPRSTENAVATRPRIQPGGLRGGQEREQAEDLLKQQAEKTTDLLEDVRELVEQAETPQPLLAQSLYEAFQDARDAEVDQRLKAAAEMVKRGFDTEAQRQSASVRPTIERLSDRIEAAAESVLGDRSEDLRRAAETLQTLAKGLDAEMPEQSKPSTASSQPPESDSTRSQNQPDRPDPTTSAESGSQPGRGEQQDQDSKSDPESPPNQSSQQGQTGVPNQASGSDQASGSGQPSGSDQASGSDQPLGSGRGLRPASGTTQDQRSPRQQPSLRGDSESPSQSSRSSQTTPSANGGGGRSVAAASSPATPGAAASPLTGDGFTPWSDAMRDVEELVQRDDLRSRATQIRQRVREARAEFKRHSQAPRWDSVQEMIVKPLRQLQADVEAEYLRQSDPENAMVPIDRDPVPDDYTDAVQTYYQRLSQP